MSPFDPWSTPPRNHLELLRMYDAQIRDAYARGEYEPVVWPYRTWGFIVVLVYLALPPSQSSVVKLLRFPVFGYFVYWSYRCMVETRSIHMHSNYGIGLINVWSVIWLAALMIFSDARREAQGIERRERREDEKPALPNGTTKEAEDPSTTTRSAIKDNDSLRLRSTKASSKATEKNITTEPEYIYHWQPLPSTLLPRLLWLYHLTTSFRGASWTFQTSQIPPPPPQIQPTLPPPPTSDPSLAPSLARKTAYPTRRQLLRSNTLLFTTCYLLIDAWKTFALRDPYFWGYTSLPPPSSYPLILRSSGTLTHAYRLCISLVGVWAALNFITSLNFLVYCYLLGPQSKLMGAKGEEWLYTPFWGPVRVLWEQGLRGWWGSWWHQLFRVGFMAPTRWALGKLGWEGLSLRGRALGLGVAFGLSAAVHAGGSWTSWGASQPGGPALFFALQGLGVGAEGLVLDWCKRKELERRVPAVVRKVVIGAWVVVWMYFTAGLLVGDFAKSGIWLFEPIPVSLFRGLGLGLEEEGWWCWHGPMAWWHWGDRWYESGIAL
ncbi:MAG: hypothetical protein MMC23_006006 [Stictis urceolatum]|nr:hypothetical protein [Stictis urceolata]